MPTEIRTFSDKVVLNVTVTTGAHTANDVLFDTTELVTLLKPKGTATIVDVILVDPDEQDAQTDIFFFDREVTLGTANEAASITDANLQTAYLGKVEITASDYTTINATSVGEVNDVGKVISAASNTSKIYVGAITRGTPTYAGASLTLKVGLFLDA